MEQYLVLYVNVSSGHHEINLVTPITTKTLIIISIY